MANLTTTDIDVSEVPLGDNYYDHDNVFNGADVLAKGTILARNTSDNKWQLYVKGGSSNGNGVPRGVLTYDVETVAGDNSLMVCVGGRVSKEMLKIDADGDGSNIDNVVLDLLRDTGIIPIDREQLALDDNVQMVDS